VTRKSRLTALASVVVIGVAGLYSSRFTTHVQPTANDEMVYVDPAICGRCHVRTAETYRQTAMGRSFSRPRSEDRVEDVKTHNTFYHKASDRYYATVERNGKLYQRRHQIGFGGKETNELEKQIDFVVGSGTHARTYLHRDSEGKLIQLPVSWYSEKGGYWAMSPGYDRPDQQDFRRRAAYDCMFCHNGYPPAQQVSTGDEPVYGDQMPEGIDCQRCHGPGGAHVKAASSSSTAQAIRAAIVNPARLGRERQLDVCMQCHLETTSLRLPNAIRKYDRAPFSYRPGQRLTDYQLFFDHPPGTGFDDHFEIAHQAYRLRKSACFQKSQMTCSTCHNPHDVPRGRQALEHYVGVCRGCHSSGHPAGSARAPVLTAAANCLDCHMPKRRTNDVVHVVMTDHYIQRQKPARDLMVSLDDPGQSANSAYRGEVVPYYPLPFPKTPDAELYLAVAQVQQESNLASGIPRLERALETYKPARPEFYFEVGRGYSKLGKNEHALQWYEEALRRSNNFRPALREQAGVFTSLGRLASAIEAGERAAVAGPPDPISLTNLGNAYLQQGNFDRAAQVLQRALSLNTDLPEAANLLGLAQLRKQDPAAAEASFRNAVRIQPDLAEAHNNLGSLLAGARKYPEAAFHFEKAIAANPRYVEAHHSYGILLELMRSWDKALAQLQEAVRLGPTAVQAHLDLAELLVATGRIANAVEAYRRVIQLKPDLVGAYYGLGTALLKQGKPADAERQLRLAIQNNPEYHEAHLALGTILSHNGKRAEARQHYQKAAESTDPEVRRSALSP
jgi:tetratricopeptide (TPR) repeat protein